MAENTTRVVELNSYMMKKNGDDSHLFARLPAPFLLMKDKGKQALQPLLQALFDNIDDALFELADKAEDNNQQNLYFESMRELRIKRRGMELAFGKELDHAFRNLLVDNSQPPTLSDSDEMTSDSLALVANDELEELVAVDNMIIKAEREFSQLLKPLTTRLDTLIDKQQVTVKNNPFSPSVVCYSFIAVCKTLDLDIKAKLVLFKLFDRYVMSSLDQLYTSSNQVLVEGGILPKLGHNNPATAPPTAQQQEGQPALETAQPDNGSHNKAFNDLQNLLHGIPQPANSTAASGLVAPGQAPQIPRDTLLQLLQAVQASLTPQLERQQHQALQGVGPQQLDVQQTLSALLSAKLPSKPMSIGQIDDEAINLVAMLFQFILDDRNLAAPMKALIARLQIPLIKVAMFDKSFFSKGGHPARKLLNEIANASLGWVPANNIERDPLYSKVSTIVTRVTDEYDGDGSLFQEVLTDFMAFLEMDKRRIGLIEQRTINAEDGKAKSERARSIVQAALNEKVAGKPLPKVVITLLEDAWSNVLFLICLKDGEESQIWLDAMQVVDDLLWSVGTMDAVESRQQLLSMVPKLLKSLRAGLTRIGYNPFDMNQLFADLELIHLAQLKELNTVKLDVTEQEVRQQQSIAKQEIAKQASAIEKSLDLVLEERSGDELSLEALDAELDEQLAEFDALGDLVATAVEATIAPVLPSANDDEMVVAELPEQSPESDKLERLVVDRLELSGGDSAAAESRVEIAEDDPSVKLVDRMSMGHWFELHQEDGKKFRCRLAAIIRSTGKYIFVNRSGMKVAEYNRLNLAQAVKDGLVSALDEGQLFDRALESVIGNLRKMKSGEV
jgi:hypothetical protein